MDAALANAIIDRDWSDFAAQVQRLQLGSPERDGTRIDIVVSPLGSAKRFRAVLLCDDYDAEAPVLDFADPANPAHLSREFWPNIEGAPINSVTYAGRFLPIICVVGTRGYHLHTSHSAEQHPKSIWRLPVVAGILQRFLRMGRLVGRGV
jgi:hypothetical protein